MLPLFQNNFILVEATSSLFFRVTTSTQQLLFWGSYFFRTAAVFSFFRTVTFSQELFFQNSFFFGAKILQNSHFLRIGGSLQQLLFGTAIFSEELFRIKISKKELLFQSRYFCTASTFSEKLHFRITYFFWRAVFLEQLFSQKTPLPQQLRFEKSYFFTTYFFRRVTISQLRFVSTDTLNSYFFRQ